MNPLQFYEANNSIFETLKFYGTELIFLLFDNSRENLFMEFTTHLIDPNCWELGIPFFILQYNNKKEGEWKDLFLVRLVILLCADGAHQHSLSSNATRIDDSCD